MGSLLTQIAALFVRALRRDSRNLFSHLMRGGLALMLVVILAASYSQMTTFSAVGLRLFEMVMWVNFMFISVAAVGYFSTSITEEKEEETLGLLRMAGVSPLSLLFGKSVSRLWLAVVLLSVQFPFALLSITLGGVTLRQIAACYIALAGYTFFLSGMATFCSVVTPRSMKAVVYMVVGSVLLFLLPEICSAVDDLAAISFRKVFSDRPELAVLWIDRAEAVTSWLWRLSISSRLMAVLSTGFDEPLFEQHFRAHTISGCFFYLLSWLFFDFFAYRHVDHSSGRGSRSLLKKLRLNAGRAWRNAIVWKDYSFGSGGLRATLMRCLLIAAGTGLFAWFAWYNRWPGSRFEVKDVGSILFKWSIFLTFIECTVQSVRLLSDEYAQRTLPILAMAPGSPSGKVAAKVLGLLVGLLPNFIAFFVSLFLNPELVSDYLEEATREPVFFFGSAYMLILAMLFFHLNAFFASYVKWVSVPLSFGTLLAFTVFCVFTTLGPGASQSTGTVVFFLMDVLGLIAIAVLMAAIVRRFVVLQER